MPKHQVRASAPNLAGVVPYDPKYIPAEVMISANENPDDVDQEIRREIEHEIRKVHLNRYPDPLANGLRDLIAEANGLDRDNVIVGNGGDELLFNIALAYGGPGRTMLNIPPTFSVYAYNAMLTRTNVVDIPRLPDFSIDEDAVVQRVAQGDIDYLTITSPNNPTGRTVSADVLKKIAEKCLRNNIIFVCDECFMPFVENAEQLSARNCFNQNVIVLKAFTKICSMAGIRLGYAVFGDSGLADMVRRTGQYWSVSSPAQTAGFAALQETGFIEKTVRYVSEERDFLFRELKKTGFKVYPSEANFLLFRCELPLDVLLLKEGIALRNCQNYDGLGAGYFRTAVRTHEENTALIEALRRVANG